MASARPGCVSKSAQKSKEYYKLEELPHICGGQMPLSPGQCTPRQTWDFYV